MKEHEGEETQIDLSEQLRSLIKSKAQGVEGLDELIAGTIKQIMDKAGIDPNTMEKFVKKEGE